MKFGILANLGKPEALEAARKICDYFLEKEIPYAVPIRLARLIDEVQGMVGHEEFGPGLDLCLVFGGDGTLLNAAQKLLKFTVPMMAINAGGMLGFLTETDLDGLFKSMPLLLEGKFTLDKRLTLRTNVQHHTRVIHERTAVNDIVISRGSLAQIIEVETWINGQPLVLFRGDGVLVSTPTGSTAYNLSTGGPIMDPEVESILLTPICAHTLSVRTVVLSANDVLELRVASPSGQSVAASVDGANWFELSSEDRVIIKKADQHFILAHCGESNFYSHLRRKMGWGGLDRRNDLF